MNKDWRNLYQETIDYLKATIVSKKGGIPVNNLHDEYFNCVGENIPLRQLNFRDLDDLLNTVTGIKILNENGIEKVYVISSKSGHIANLVENQKNKRFNQKRVNFQNSQKNSFFQRRIRSSSTGSRSSSRGCKSDAESDDFGSHVSRSSQGSNIVIQIDPYKRMKSICEPIAYNQQLIGDDFFLQLAIRNLRVNNLWRKSDKSAIHSGLCISGQTIYDCVSRLSEIENISNRLVIMLGAVDVYQSRTATEMIDDFNCLLQMLENKFLLSKSAITICTIPPLANVPIINEFDKLCALYNFNSYIRNLASKKAGSDNYGFLDFFNEFNYTDTEFNQRTIDFDLFQIQARMVSGCPNPHVLWNKKGRTKAMQLLKNSSTFNYSKTEWEF